MDVLFGCHISVKNFIFGGLKGKSGGKFKVALKNPPSYKVSGGLSNQFTSASSIPKQRGVRVDEEGCEETDPKIVISHSKTLSSSTKPAEKPSTGCFLNSARGTRYGKSAKRRVLKEVEVRELRSRRKRGSRCN